MYTRAEIGIERLIQSLGRTLRAIHRLCEDQMIRIPRWFVCLSEQVAKITKK